MQVEQLPFDFMKDFNSEGKNEREYKVSSASETICDRESNKHCLQTHTRKCDTGEI